MLGTFFDVNLEILAAVDPVEWELVERQVSDDAPMVDAPRFVELAIGKAHVCGLEPAGTVACWGANESGELGDGTLVDRATAAPVAGLSSVEHLIAGERFTCALRSDGTVWCWGANDHGQLGDGSRFDRPFPTQPLNVSNASAISVADERVCARSRGGFATCWGEAR